jgi:hypothetical protein
MSIMSKLVPDPNKFGSLVVHIMIFSYLSVLAQMHSCGNECDLNILMVY